MLWGGRADHIEMSLPEEIDIFLMTTQISIVQEVSRSPIQER